MKFSVLLPTRDRLELLKLAIESVRRQDYGDWEIVVSDNDSAENVAGFVTSLGDSRIRYRRTDTLIPVTENWNAALQVSSGDYFIMLGDDDALTPGSLSEAERLIESWRSPDAIYAQAHQYAYPGVVPGHPEAFVQTGYNAFLENVSEPFRLRREIALKMVRGAAAFYILYGFNMQHFVVSRRLVERLAKKGPFFQSPYPDYYAANAVLLAADPLVVTPRPLAMIGISPKSFGFYYVNKREQDGVAFLQNRVDDRIARKLRGQFVPGSNMNDSWLCAMETIVSNFPEAHGLRVRYSRYRRLQFHELLKNRRRGRIRMALRNMRPWEIIVYGIAALLWSTTRVLPSSLGRGIREAMLHAAFACSPRFDPNQISVPCRNILEAAWERGG